MFKFNEQFRKDHPETIGETDSIFDLYNYKDWLELQIENPIIWHDINGKPIRKADKFKFKYMKELHKHIELIGSFDWNENELRYEIDIWDDDIYVCLSFVGNGVMYGFELLS